MKNSKNQTAFTSLGDICMDIYVDEGERYPGGTALNVAVAASRAGAQTSIASAIGTDRYAKEVQSVCVEHDIDTHYLQVIEGETSSIHITREEKQKYPVFSGWKMGVLGEFRFTPEIEAFLKTQDVARAVLFREIRDAFETFCSFHLPDTLKAADFSGTSLYSEGVEVITRYIKGLDVIIKSLESKNTQARALLQQLAYKYPQKIFVLLRGKDGSSVLRNGKQFHQPAISVDVIDTNGAGDAYVGTFLVVYSQTQDVQKAMEAAASAASDTITHLGAI